MNDETRKVPKHVCILGMGPSLRVYPEITKRVGGRSNFCDEVWAINALGEVYDCDKVFHMDDVRIQEIRAAARPDSNIAAMLAWLKRSRVPVMTSRDHPDYPALIEFPLEDVINNLGWAYFNSTAAYAVAYAIHIGVEKISCYGMDYTYLDAHTAEKGRACVEYWLGFARARGIKVSMPNATSLMDACYSQEERLYGYDTVRVQINIDQAGKAALGYFERETLPTADEIEARYNHDAHPNALVEDPEVTQ